MFIWCILCPHVRFLQMSSVSEHRVFLFHQIWSKTFIFSWLRSDSCSSSTVMLCFGHTLVKKSGFKIYFYLRWCFLTDGILPAQSDVLRLSAPPLRLFKTIFFFLHVIEFGFFPFWSFATLKKRNSREEIVHYSSCSRSVMEFSTDEETLLTELPLV